VPGRSPDYGSGHMRTDPAQIVEEQEALRRIAMLVAGQATRSEVLGAIAEELYRLLGVESIRLLRYDTQRDGSPIATVVGAWGEDQVLVVGEQRPLGGDNVTTRVFETGRPATIEDYEAASGAIADRVREAPIRSAAAAPVLVDGRLWGVFVAAALGPGKLTADTAERLTRFTELMGMAIANTEARAQVARLAEEQAALRRVAVLVAQGVRPAEVFDAVIGEVAALLSAEHIALVRRSGPGEITILAGRGHDPELLRPGMRVAIDGDSVIARVLAAGRPARVEGYADRDGEIADLARRWDVEIGVGAPIVVDGALWGVIVISFSGHRPPAADAEARLAEFAELLGTAVANADTHDQLNASRARLLAAGDEARRRVVRDLHDGAQQRLVHTIVTLGMARRALRESRDGAEALLDEAIAQAEQATAELRELSHGILPTVLTRGGLRAAVDDLVTRLGLPVDLDVTDARVAAEIEASAYFVVAETLTNVVKHARAHRASVTAAVDGPTLRLEVRDDGVGGADPGGNGLVGLGDRVAALGGTLRIDSPAGAGTVVAVELPLPA